MELEEVEQQIRQAAVSEHHNLTAGEARPAKPWAGDRSDAVLSSAQPLGNITNIAHRSPSHQQKHNPRLKNPPASIISMTTTLDAEARRLLDRVRSLTVAPPEAATQGEGVMTRGAVAATSAGQRGAINQRGGSMTRLAQEQCWQGGSRKLAARTGDTQHGTLGAGARTVRQRLVTAPTGSRSEAPPLGLELQLGGLLEEIELQATMQQLLGAITASELWREEGADGPSAQPSSSRSDGDLEETRSFATGNASEKDAPARDNHSNHASDDDEGHEDSARHARLCILMINRWRRGTAQMQKRRVRALAWLQQRRYGGRSLLYNIQ